jgi:hypothetical protein
MQSCGYQGLTVNVQQSSARSSSLALRQDYYYLRFRGIATPEMANSETMASTSLEERGDVVRAYTLFVCHDLV